MSTPPPTSTPDDDPAATGTPRGTALDVLLAHGLDRNIVDRLHTVFPRTEVAAASVFRHHDGQCAGSPSCPWHPSGALAEDVEAVLAAVNAWCMVGWLERGLLRSGYQAAAEGEPPDPRSP